MRVLVTGCSGHVGAAIARRLHADGHEVVGLSRRLPRACRFLPTALAVDIGQPGLVSALGERTACQAVVHAAAALPGAPGTELVRTNCLGTEQLLELAGQWSARCFVFCSSVQVVGRPGPAPITEANPVSPRSTYHATKAFGEQLLALAADALRPVVLRLSAPVGAGMARERILPVFVRRALADAPLTVAGDGSRMQDYVDAQDVATAVAASLSGQATGVFNIASGRPVSNLELARRCVTALGSRSPIELGGQPDLEAGVSWRVSIERARRELGFMARISLEDSIAAVAREMGAPGVG